MNPRKLASLQTQSEELASAIRVMGFNLQAQDSALESADLSETSLNIAKAKADILARLDVMRALLDGPTEFLQRLTTQVQVLACLKWLNDFQILACIPLEGSLPISDLADLAGVPDDQLRRVIRLTVGCRFLRETQPNYVAHTELSGQFLACQSLCDATDFIAGALVPAALHMGEATRRTMQAAGLGLSPVGSLAINNEYDGGSKSGGLHFGREPSLSLPPPPPPPPHSSQQKQHAETAYDIALEPMKPFCTARQEPTKLARQWNAYMAHAAQLHSEDELINTFSRLHWPSLGNTCIVEIGAQTASLARNLARTFGNLQVLVQVHDFDTLDRIRESSPDEEELRYIDGKNGEDLNEQLIQLTNTHNNGKNSNKDSRTTIVTLREPGSPQPITTAAVYILHLNSRHSSSSHQRRECREAVWFELTRHLKPLRVSGGGILLVLTARLLPTPGSMGDRIGVEAAARARDLSMLQLANEGEMEMSELLDIVESVTDNVGKLTVANELRSHDGLVLALVLKHRYHGSAQ